MNAIKTRLRKFDQVHLKLGALIFGLFLILLIVLGSVLYVLFLDFYLRQATNEIIHRGHSHAAVLSQDFTDETLRHVELMEKYALTSVAVVNESGKIVAQSRPLLPSQMPYARPLRVNNANRYELVETDWRNSPFLVSKSLVTAQGKPIATVVMFTPTEPIRLAVQSLRQIFLLTLAVALAASGILIFLIAKWITRPLANMRNAVKQLTRNSYDLSLHAEGHDEIAELNRSILELSRELKHYRAERQVFLAELSHELRTPITYMKGYAEILNKGIIWDEEERSKYLRFIQDAANRMFQLVNDLFELIELDRVEYRLNKRDTDFVGLLDGIAEEMRDRFAARGITLIWQPPRYKPIAAFVDEDRIRQVIVNLLENARKFTLEGGAVEIGLIEREKEVEFFVRDSGVGIPKQELPLIWQHFYRVEKSRSRQHGGAGLGLSICKRIVDLHNGSISVESEWEKGAIFTVRLPRYNNRDLVNTKNGYGATNL